MVVYIIGDNRSGTTLLDYLLSSHPDVHSVGELHNLNEYYSKKGTGVSRDWKCSCGFQLNKCKFWSSILSQMNYRHENHTKMKLKEPQYYIPYHSNFITRIKNILLNNQDQGENFANIIWRLYSIIKNQTRKPIILDSSKSGFEAYYLNKYRKGEIKFILIEREIRAVSYSKIKRLAQLEVYGKKSYSINRHLYNSFKILWYNRYCIRLIQADREDESIAYVKYNELAHNPQKVISRLQDFLGIENSAIPDKTNSVMEELHILGGSPSRYDRRPIRPNEEWKNYYKNHPISSIIGKLLEHQSK